MRRSFKAKDIEQENLDEWQQPTDGAGKKVSKGDRLTDRSRNTQTLLMSNGQPAHGTPSDASDLNSSLCGNSYMGKPRGAGNFVPKFTTGLSGHLHIPAYTCPTMN